MFNSYEYRAPFGFNTLKTDQTSPVFMNPWIFLLGQVPVHTPTKVCKTVAATTIAKTITIAVATIEQLWHLLLIITF